MAIFNTQLYLLFNPDVEKHWVNTGLGTAWQHYQQWGQAEGRPAFFATQAYLALNPDVAAAIDSGAFAGTALDHYRQWGRQEGRFIAFDSQDYLQLNPDVAQNWHGTALEHYLKWGEQEGRQTSFDAQAYRVANPDVAQNWGGTALEHYLQWGKHEGRSPNPVISLQQTDSDSSIGFADSSVSVTEGDTGSATLNLSVVLDQSVAEIREVDYTTLGGTATSGMDYAPASGTLSFIPGQQQQNLALEIYGDLNSETPETFKVLLSNPGPDTVVSQDQGAASVTIIDNDTTDNTAPSASADYGTLTTGQSLTLDVLANDSDSDGQNLLIDNLSPPEQGTASLAANNTISYTAPAEYTGSDSFTYTISDGVGGTASATVTLTSDKNLQPTAAEQLMLERLNAERADPDGYADQYGLSDLNEGVPVDQHISPQAKQPVAFDPLLTEAARDHSQWMLDTDIFSHTGVSGTDAGDRISATGYDWWGWGENIAYSGQTRTPPDLHSTTLQLEENLFVDEDYYQRGHRTNMLDPDWIEVGLGIKEGIYTTNNDYHTVMATQNFAVPQSQNHFLLGTVYQNSDGDNAYDAGEGVAGATVSAISQQDDIQYVTQTLAAGGYQMALEPGTYDLNFSWQDQQYSGQVEMTGTNEKVDWIMA